MIFIALPVLFITLFVTHNWFVPGFLAGYDSLFYFKESYSLYSVYPYAWSTMRDSGLGGTFIPLLWGYASNGVAMGIGNIFGLSWDLVDKVVFYFPFLILSFVSAWFFAQKTLVSKSFALLASFIYTINSYILMIVSGGQVHFALAYAITPIVVYFFLSTINQISLLSSKKIRIKEILSPSLIAGVCLSLQMSLDIRVGYVALVAVIIYLPFVHEIISGFVFKKFLLLILFTCIIPFLSTAIILAFWTMPAFFAGGGSVSQLDGGYVIGNESVKFLSFAKFENTISLLHPNWPDNIFGKVGFMKPEFLVLPLLAYSSMLFIDSKDKARKKYILYFALVGILGAFLAKGANDPFGDVYLWLFNNLPGFNAFRDPSKWYILIALAYSVLIPYAIEKIYIVLNKKKYENTK